MSMDRVYTKAIDEPPGEYTVTCLSAPMKDLGGKRAWSRVANCNSLADAMQSIQRDMESCRDTMGGLFDPTNTEGREYAIWKATWERVQ